MSVRSTAGILIREVIREDAMSIRSTLLSRKSIRTYSGEHIPDDVLNEILSAGLLAPSSRNLKPCLFTVVRSREILAELSRAKAAGGAFLRDADAAVVVSADAELADTWAEDCSIALTCMHLAAAEAGVGSCWVQIHLRRDRDGGDAEENVRRILGLEQRFRTVGILSLGMPASSPVASEKEVDFDRVRVLD